MGGISEVECVTEVECVRNLGVLQPAPKLRVTVSQAHLRAPGPVDTGYEHLHTACYLCPSSHSLSCYAKSRTEQQGRSQAAPVAQARRGLQAPAGPAPVCPGGARGAGRYQVLFMYMIFLH